MRNYTAIAVVAGAMLMSSCTNTEDPQLAMCQAVTKQLLGNTISNWDNITQQDTKKLRSIDISFTQEDGSTSQVNCDYPIKDNGDVDTAPNSLVLNGQKIATPELFKAGLKASGELLKGTAANTVEKSKELANEAKALASDATVKVRESAADASNIASEVVDKARESAADASVIATEIADKAKEGASKMAGEVTEKAREKALQATELLHNKLDN